MSDEKTEEPTDKKLRDAHRDGETAKSADLIAAVVLLTGCLLLAMTASLLGDRWRALVDLALDVNNPLYSLNRVDPAPSYNAVYLQSVFATIDAFVGYSNVLVFFSGNEVINMANNTVSAPYVKAVTRDMKQYIGERGYRAVPVGYSAADVSENQYLMAQYMSCGESQTQGDFYAINNYEWCSPSSFNQSGWDKLVETYTNYSQPLL
jgi:hypothetical protein